MPKGEYVRQNRQRPNAGTVSGLSSAAVPVISTVIVSDPSGAQRLDGNLIIGADGVIYQGTFQTGYENDFDYPDTGLKIWTDTRADGSLIGTIAGYKDATLQWSSNTDGQLVAGAGAVVLDEDGITADAGEIAGWSITADYLGGGDTYLYPNGDIVVGTVGDIVRISSSHATYRLWAGAYAPEDAPFSVDKTGYLFAKRGGFGGTSAAPAIVLDETTGQVTIPKTIYLGDDPSYAVLFDGSAATPAMKSVGYVAETTGWYVDADGNTEFNDLVARGSLEAAAGIVTVDTQGITIEQGDSAQHQIKWTNATEAFAWLNAYESMVYQQLAMLIRPDADHDGDILLDVYNVDASASATLGINVSPTPATLPPQVYASVNGARVATFSAAGLELTGSVLGSTAIGARVYRSTTQSIASGSYAALSWDSEYADTDSCWAAANPTRLTATHAGYYAVGANVTWASAPSVVWYIRVRDQDGNVIAANTYLAGAIVGGITAGMVYLDAADYVTVEVYQNSGGAINLRAGTTAQQDYNTGWLQRIA